MKRHRYLLSHALLNPSTTTKIGTGTPADWCAPSRGRDGVRIARRLLIAALGMLVAAPPVSAQNVIAYPARGQTQEQQQRDRFDCYQWAVTQTGFNPEQQAYGPPAGATPPQQDMGGGLMRGAFGGAALGAAGGAIGGDAGKGAAIGAGVGGLFGAARRREAGMQQQQMQSQQAAASGQQRASFNRAMGACLQGRGYSVN